LRDEANVTWWGFDPHDSTEYVRAAINSGARRVRIPNVGANWVVLPINLRDDLELILEEGVVLEAKKGAYLGINHSVLNLQDVRNVTIRGYGATLKMHKDDYANPALYDKAEWRHGINVRGGTNIQILGLTIKDTGGDGIYLGRGQTKPYNENVVIRDVVADNNYRQGISVISAKGLLIENSVFRNTGGTSPEDGIDFEPNLPDEVLEDIVVRRTTIENNGGHGISFYLWNMADKEVSILVEDVVIRGNRYGIGLRGGSNLSGEIKVRDCIIEETKSSAFRMRGHRRGEAFQFTMEDCFIRHVAQDPLSAYEQPVPIYMGSGSRVGKVAFDNVVVIDDRDRPAVYGDLVSDAFFDIRGEVAVVGPFAHRVVLEGPAENVTLEAAARDFAVIPYDRISGAGGTRCCAETFGREPGVRIANLAMLKPYTTVQGDFHPQLELVSNGDVQVDSVVVRLDGGVIYTGDRLPTGGELAIDAGLLEDGLHALEIEVAYGRGKQAKTVAVFESQDVDAHVLFEEDFSGDPIGSRPANWRVQGSNVSVQVARDPHGEDGHVVHIRADAGNRRDVGIEGPAWSGAARDARVIALEFDVLYVEGSANLYVTVPGAIPLHLRLIQPGELRRGDSLISKLGAGWNRIRIVADRAAGTGQAYVWDLESPGKAPVPVTFTFRDRVNSWEGARIRFMNAVFPDQGAEVYYRNFKAWIVE